MKFKKCYLAIAVSLYTGFATASPGSYTVDANPTPGAYTTTEFSHNILDRGITPYYGYYQTQFPSMNDYGVIAARVDQANALLLSAPISQPAPRGAGGQAAVWTDGVVKHLGWRYNFISWNGSSDWYKNTDGEILYQVKGCKDYGLNGIADASNCGSRANAINNAGRIVGTMNDWPNMGNSYFEKAYQWENEIIYPTLSLYRFSEQQSTPTDINEAGAMVGTGITNGGAGPQDGFEHGLITWGNALPLPGQYIGTKYQRSRAHAINDNNIATGAMFYDASEVFDGGPKPWQAYTFSNDVVNWAGYLPGGSYSEGFDINNSDVVVGRASTNGELHAFMWQSPGGAMQDIGTLGGTSSVARSINDAGTVVGSSKTAMGENHGFIYANGAMYDLNNYAPVPSGWSIVDAYTINENGQILVRAQLNGSTQTGENVYWLLSNVDFEHGGDIATAAPLKANDNVPAKINYSGDNDYFKIEIESSGQLSLATTGSTDTFGNLLDSSGSELANDGDSGTGTNFQINYIVDPGTYYLRVRHNYGITGAYSLTSSFTIGTGSGVLGGVFGAKDHGETMATATEIAPNSTIPTAIEEPGYDKDYFKIVITDEGDLKINSTGNMQPRGRLLDGNGSQLAVNDTGGEGSNFLINVSVTPGTYYVEVSTFRYDKFGLYTLESNFVPLAPPVPTYCSASGGTTSYEYANSISVDGDTRVSGDDSGYADFTGDAAFNLRYGTASVSLTPGFPYTAYYENWAVWIDFNQDGTFDSSEKVFAGGEAATLNGNFTVPTSAASGETRMRVVMNWQTIGGPCDSFTYGEVEDYLVNIQ